mmetsp:Transcript_16780/g.30378  ORF Transcript_16780/g.30378 Transcript_16780/m.30378 type:complete len:354 (+) Transcript_16780:44-1105(+)
MTLHRLLFVHSVTFVLFLTLLNTSLAFSIKNPVEHLLENLLNRGAASTKEASPPSAEQGKALLNKLDIQSNTEPRPFNAELSQLPALLTASMPAVFRLGTGVFCNGYQVSIVPKNENRYTMAKLFAKYQLLESSGVTPQLRQKEPLILYEFETCPDCRKVREAVSILSLEVTFRPCPQKGSQFRRGIETKYGKADASFPFLMDPNTNAQIFQSDAILEYLFQTYGNGNIPRTLEPKSSLVTASEAAGLLFRGSSGGIAKPSKPPPKPLKVWSYEGSPFCKLVKEKLSELEIEHTQISCPRGSANRQALFDSEGRFQVPYLKDPNTGVSLFESQAICEYLEKQYGVAKSPVKYL